MLHVPSFPQFFVQHRPLSLIAIYMYMYFKFWFVWPQYLLPLLSDPVSALFSSSIPFNLTNYNSGSKLIVIQLLSTAHILFILVVQWTPPNEEMWIMHFPGVAHSIIHTKSVYRYLGDYHYQYVIKLSQKCCCIIRIYFTAKNLQQPQRIAQYMQ